jgi:hypothetical protein
MDTNPATDRTRFSQPPPQPVLLTPVETKQVAGGSPYLPIPPAYAAHIHPYSPYIPIPPA